MQYQRSLTFSPGGRKGGCSDMFPPNKKSCIKPCYYSLISLKHMNVLTRSGFLCKDHEGEGGLQEQYETQHILTNYYLEQVKKACDQYPLLAAILEHA